MKEFHYRDYKEVIEEIFFYTRSKPRSIKWRAVMLTQGEYDLKRSELHRLENIKFYKSDFGTIGSILKFLEADHGFDVVYCRNVDSIEYFDTMYICSLPHRF